MSAEDFRRIIDLGLPDEDFLPREGILAENDSDSKIYELRTPFEIQRPIIERLVSQKKREIFFRRAVVEAYDATCAMTGWKLINGGGRAEAEAAHIRPVQSGGPDSIQNGIALSGTVHWMFDRGLISLSDNFEILISRHVNDAESVERILNKDRVAIIPDKRALRPHPAFLKWHRENCFKQ